MNPLSLNIEQTYLFRHRAIDNVGYASQELEEKFIVDLSSWKRLEVLENFQGSILSKESVSLKSR